jgi:hypothetical protein
MCRPMAKRTFPVRGVLAIKTSVVLSRFPAQHRGTSLFGQISLEAVARPNRVRIFGEQERCVTLFRVYVS